MVDLTSGFLVAFLLLLKRARRRRVAVRGLLRRRAKPCAQGLASQKGSFGK